jgi:hypothetical protein
MKINVCFYIIRKTFFKIVNFNRKQSLSLLTQFYGKKSADFERESVNPATGKPIARLAEADKVSFFSLS